jgi:ABC-2 type transport system permease protein
MGVAMGFFIGSIGRIKYEAKIGITMAIVMTLSFMSGLMVSGIKALLEMHAPLVNDLNPVAIVADSFYYLSVDSDLTRYYGKLAAICIYTVVFILLGFLMTRRRKYESL